MHAVSGARILIVDDDAHLRLTLGDRLRASGYEVSEAANGEAGLQVVRALEPEVVMLDMQMPGMDGLEVLRQLQREEISTTVVVITAYGSIEVAVEAMREGAFDFVPKPFKPERISVVVQKAVEHERLRRENEWLHSEMDQVKNAPTSKAASMREVLEMARKVAQSSATVLLLGESGSGKGVLARSIHDWSTRRALPFVVVNCVALPDQLLESELFGFEKGAFTGAEKQRKGRFELARGGTIFLDEVGATSKDFQLKLLRVLQEGAFVRLGGEREIHTDARIIAATNRNLEEAVRSGRFMEDLYYRLNVVPISVPPLRQCREDIAELARSFLQKYAHETKRHVVAIATDAIACMEDYDWPGNVRELENAIERAIVLGRDEHIEVDDLPEQVRNGDKGTGRSDLELGFHEAVEVCKRDLIERALERTDGNQSQAAELLGVQRTYLNRLLKQMGLR